MTRTPQQKGRDFEVEWSKRFGIRLTPASGALWFAKMDAGGKGLLWSLKHTVHKSFSIDLDLVDEVTDAAVGPGGNAAIPAIGIRLHSDPAYDLVVLRADDFLRLVTEERKLVTESVADARRRTARIPAALRGDDVSD